MGAKAGISFGTVVCAVCPAGGQEFMFWLALSLSRKLLSAQMHSALSLSRLSKTCHINTGAARSFVSCGHSRWKSA